MLPSAEMIKLFWQWFESIAAELDENHTNIDLVDELDKRIKSLGSIGWELGPGVINPSAQMLVLTPCGNKDLLPFTKYIISLAPNILGWEFYPAKPPKQWRQSFTIKDDNGQDIKIDASAWRYVLLKFPDNMYDLIIIAPEMANLSDKIRGAAAEIVVDGQLGEELRLEKIANIEIVYSFNDDLPQQKGSSIRDLAAHVNQLKG